MKYEKPIINIEMFISENILTASGDPVKTRADLADGITALDSVKNTKVIPFNF